MCVAIHGQAAWESAFDRVWLWPVRVYSVIHKIGCAPAEQQIIPGLLLVVFSRRVSVQHYFFNFTQC